MTFIRFAFALLEDLFELCVLALFLWCIFAWAQAFPL